MNAYERLTMAITHARTLGRRHRQSGTAGHTRTLSGLLTDDERAQRQPPMTPAGLTEALDAMGFASLEEVNVWEQEPARTVEDIVARYERARDVLLLHQFATVSALDVADDRTAAACPIENTIRTLMSIFLTGEREEDLGDILTPYSPVVAGYIVYQVTTRLARRAAADELERLGCWLTVQAVFDACSQESDAPDGTSD